MKLLPLILIYFIFILFFNFIGLYLIILRLQVNYILLNIIIYFLYLYVINFFL